MKYFVLLCLVCLALIPQVCSAQEATLAWFTDADIPSSVKVVKPANAQADVAGSYLNGISLNKSVGIYSSVINQQQGMISFWIKPNWNGNDNADHIFLKMGDPASNGFVIEKSAQNSLRFAMAGAGVVTSARVDVSNWQNGNWHHVVGCWTTKNDKPLGLALWLDKTCVDSVVYAGTSFMNPATMADKNIYIGDTASNAVMDELIIRNGYWGSFGGSQISMVYRDYFRTAPYTEIKIDPDSNGLPSDTRVVLNAQKQFGLQAKRQEGNWEPVTNFYVRYGNWADFDAKPFIDWTISNGSSATVDNGQFDSRRGEVTGNSVGSCTLNASFRGMNTTYPVSVISWDKPDLDIMYVERYPRYSRDGTKKWVYGGNYLSPQAANGRTWPAEGDPITSVVHYGNYGFEPTGASKLKFELVSDDNDNFVCDASDTVKYTTTADVPSLSPGATATQVFTWTWPRTSQGEHQVFVRVTADPLSSVDEICEANNQRCELNTAQAFFWRYDSQFFSDNYNNRSINYIGSFSTYDWSNAQIDKLAQLMRDTVLPTTSPIGVKDSIRVDDYLPQTVPVFDNEPNIWDREAYYDDFYVSLEPWNHTLLDFDPAINHEITHGLNTPDLYGHPQVIHNVFLKDNSGQPYGGSQLYPDVTGDGTSFLPGKVMYNNSDALAFGYSCLMDYCHWWWDPYIAGIVHHTAGDRNDDHRNVGAVTACPKTNVMQILDVDDKPLQNAAVYAYQMVQAPAGLDYNIIGTTSLCWSKYLPDRPKFVGNTDSSGSWAFPKTTDSQWDDWDTDAADGSITCSQPFHRVNNEFDGPSFISGGYFVLKIVGANGQVEFRTISQIELWNAYMSGFTDTATYTIKTDLTSTATPVSIVRPTIPDAIKTTNLKPVAVVPLDVYAKPGQLYSIDGSASYDPEGQPLIYRWLGFGDDRGNDAPFSTPAVHQAVSPYALGDYKYQFYVMDGLRASDVATITLHVVSDVQTVTGYVTDTNGNPINRAIVHIGNNTNYRQVITGTNGQFTFYITPEQFPGKKYLLLTADAWQYANKDVLVDLDSTQSVTLQLAPKVETSAISNSTFDTTVSGWTFSGPTGATWTLGTDNHPIGTGKCGKVTIPNVGYTGWAVNKTMSVTPGKVYNLNLWRQTQNSSNSEEYWFYDSTGAEIFYSGMNTGDRHTASNVTDGAWWRLDANQFIYRIKVPDKATTMKVQFGGDTFSSASILIDDIQLEPVVPVTGKVSGEVVDSKGVGVSGAYVFYKDDKNAGMDARTTDFVKTDTNGNYSIDLPLGEYYIAAFKETYRPSADAYVLVDSNKAMDNITLETAKTNLVLNKSSLITVSSTMSGYNKSSMVDGSTSTIWKSLLEDSPEYATVKFTVPEDLSDIVLYRDIVHTWLGTNYDDYTIKVMTKGDPNDANAWSAAAPDVQTLYSKTSSYMGSEVSSGVALCTMPVSIRKALGVRIDITNRPWWDEGKPAAIRELEIHGSNTVLDTTPPVMGPVTTDSNTFSGSAFSVNWSATDPDSGVGEYKVAVGTTPTDPGSGYVSDWTSVGTLTSLRITWLTTVVGQTYYVYVKAANGDGTWSAAAVSNGITKLADTTPPTMGTVSMQTYSGNIYGYWSATDNESSVAEYQYAVGTTPTDPGSGYVLNWTSAGLNTSSILYGFDLTDGRTYYLYVKAKNSQGMWSSVAASTGVKCYTGYTIGQIKSLPAGSLVKINDVVSCGPNPTNYGFYVEDQNRSAGIWATYYYGTYPAGTVMDVVAKTTAFYGECYLTDPVITQKGTADIDPLFMNNSKIGGGQLGLQDAVMSCKLVTNSDGSTQNASFNDSGLNNVGLLIKTTGIVTYIDPNGQFAYIDDGSGVSDGNTLGPNYTSVIGIRVALRTTLSNFTVPAVGDMVDVTGVSSTYVMTYYPKLVVSVIRPRSQDDIVEIPME